MRHPLTDILRNPLIDEFLADVSPNMTRAELAEVAAKWLSYIDNEYADKGITLTVADMNFSLAAMIDLARQRFERDAEMERFLASEQKWRPDGERAWIWGVV